MHAGCHAQQTAPKAHGRDYGPRPPSADTAVQEQQLPMMTMMTGAMTTGATAMEMAMEMAERGGAAHGSSAHACGPVAHKSVHTCQDDHEQEDMLL